MAQVPNQNDLLGIIKDAFLNLSCEDFDPRIANDELIKKLRPKLRIKLPFWDTPKHPVSPYLNNHNISAYNTIVFHLLPPEPELHENERSLPETAYFLKISAESANIIIELIKLEKTSEYSNNFFDESKLKIVLAKKELFKNCQGFIDAFKDILTQVLDTV